MQPTDLFVYAGIALAGLAPLILLACVCGFLTARWRRRSGACLIAGAVGSILLTTVYLFIALYLSDMLAGMDSQAWLVLFGAGFTVGAIFYATPSKRNKAAVSNSV
jgi:hypothetical protein